MSSYHLDHLQYLETEAIHVLREVAAEFERPAILFSGGKDSICILRLAEKAFRPSDIPMPFLNVETGHEFPELIDFRDRRAKQLGAKLIVRTVDEAFAKGLASPTPGQISRNQLQIPVLLGAIEEFRFDCCIGGARRDEEKARAKERIFSHRDSFGQWQPKEQRPELWNLFNTRIKPGEHFRAFPISNWTELDVWLYIARENIPLPNIYYKHPRQVIRRKGLLVPLTEVTPALPGETVETVDVRFRTVGDMTCTCPVESTATSAADIVAEYNVVKEKLDSYGDIEKQYKECSQLNNEKTTYEKNKNSINNTILQNENSLISLKNKLGNVEQNIQNLNEVPETIKFSDNNLTCSFINGELQIINNGSLTLNTSVCICFFENGKYLKLGNCVFNSSVKNTKH